MKAMIKATVKSLPKTPVYSTVKIMGEKNNAVPEQKTHVPGQKAQVPVRKRDWSKVNRGANNGNYGRPIFWNEARLRVLKQLREQGKDFNEIAEEFGKTADACRRQWHKASGY